MEPLPVGDGTGLTQITDGARNVYHPDWSVDGSIYFGSNAYTSWDIWKVGIDPQALVAQ